MRLVNAALHHKRADSEVDREGLGYHLGQGLWFQTPLKMAVPSNSALFEGIGAISDTVYVSAKAQQVVA